MGRFLEKGIPRKGRNDGQRTQRFFVSCNDATVIMAIIKITKIMVQTIGHSRKRWTQSIVGGQWDSVGHWSVATSVTTVPRTWRYGGYAGNYKFRTAGSGYHSAVVGIFTNNEPANK